MTWLEFLRGVRGMYGWARCSRAWSREASATASHSDGGGVTANRRAVERADGELEQRR
ncbi:MAG: hypothetical protein RMK74_13320 [Myxococcales bacterium]|nr:hypothetical protein [Myxococcales bacterium]